MEDSCSSQQCFVLPLQTKKRHTHHHTVKNQQVLQTKGILPQIKRGRFWSVTSPVQYLRASQQELLWLWSPGLFKKRCISTSSRVTWFLASHTPLHYMFKTRLPFYPLHSVKPSAETAPSSQCVQGIASDVTGLLSLSQVVSLQRTLLGHWHTQYMQNYKRVRNALEKTLTHTFACKSY